MNKQVKLRRFWGRLLCDIKARRPISQKRQQKAQRLASVWST